jgi:predicted nucleotidyltransferase
MDYESFHKQRLLRHARTCAAALRESELVLGVIVGGSVAHGGADRESDLDILVVVRQLPEPEVRVAWLSGIMQRDVDATKLPAIEESRLDEFVWPKDDPEQWMPPGGGLMYVTQAEVTEWPQRVGEVLTRVMERDDPERTTRIEEHLADLAHGIILHDPRSLLSRSQQRLSEYPGSARAQLINYHWHRAEIAINEDVQRSVWRRDFLHAYDRRAEGVRHLVRMLFAMNRRYYRKAKGLERLLGTFPACPPDAWARLVSGLAEPDHMRGAAMLLGLAGDIIDLIEPPEILERREHWRELCNSWARQYGIG